MGKGARTLAVAPTDQSNSVSVFTRPETLGEWVGYTMEHLRAGTPVLPAPKGCLAPDWVAVWEEGETQDYYYFNEDDEGREFTESQLKDRQSDVAKTVPQLTQGNLVRLDYLLLQLYANRTDDRRGALPHGLIFEDVKGNRGVLTSFAQATGLGDARWWDDDDEGKINLVTLGDWADAYWSGAGVRWRLKVSGKERPRAIYKAKELYVQSTFTATAALTYAQAAAQLEAARVALLSVMASPSPELAKLQTETQKLTKLLGKVHDALVGSEAPSK